MILFLADSISLILYRPENILIDELRFDLNDEILHTNFVGRRSLQGFYQHFRKGSTKCKVLLDLVEILWGCTDIVGFVSAWKVVRETYGCGAKTTVFSSVQNSFYIHYS